MKYLLSLLLGTLIGGALCLLGLYLNPFAGLASVSPLAVTKSRIIDLSFSGIPAESILFTNNGESGLQTFPDSVEELWEPAIAATQIRVLPLQNSRGNAVGLGIKFSSQSEQTRLFKGEALTNSVWHAYLPGQGTLFIDQAENYWAYLRDVIVPARFSSGDEWHGTFNQITTVGPGSLGTARVTGGNGLYAEMTTESVESLTTRAYAADTGPLESRGNLTIAVPDRAEPTAQ